MKGFKKGGPKNVTEGITYPSIYYDGWICNAPVVVEIRYLFLHLRKDQNYVRPVLMDQQPSKLLKE